MLQQFELGAQSQFVNVFGYNGGVQGLLCQLAACIHICSWVCTCEVKAGGVRIDGRVMGVCWHVQNPGPTPPQGGQDTPSATQRWKFLDEGKVRKVSGRLFSAEPSSGLRRSSKVAPSPMEASPPSGPSGSAGTSPSQQCGAAEAAYGGRCRLWICCLLGSLAGECRSWQG